MAETAFFRYQDRSSFLKKVDPRIKMSLLLIYTVLLYHISTGGLILLSAFTIFLFMANYRIKSIREIKGALILSLFIGTAAFLSSYNLFFTILAVTRFLMTILLGLVLIGTTHSGEIEKAVYWFVKPVPFISETEIAMRVRLTITFIPDIMVTAAQIKEAGLSRCIQHVKNPVRKITALAVPLLYAIIRRAEGTALTMEARCYSGTRDYTLKQCTLKDLLHLSTGLAVAAGTLLV